MAVWNLLFSSILIPLVAIALLALKTRHPLATWLTTLLMAAGLAGFSFFAAPWGTFGLTLRWLIAGFFLAAVLTSAARRPSEERPDESALRMLVKVLIAFFFGGVAVGVVRGHEVPARAVDVAFPLKAGTYLVLHGGSTPASNSHLQDARQRYAVDFVRLNRLLMRARGLRPAEASRYEMFGSEISSPCGGVVEEAVDGNPDGAPSATARGPVPNPLGNYLAVRCEGGPTLFLGHLQRGSVIPLEGSSVVRGQTVARAGHSGASPEPHLHIHAERDGTPVPLTFDGQWLVRNAVIRR